MRQRRRLATDKCMNIDWSKSTVDAAPEGVLSDATSHVLHEASCQAADESAVKLAVIETAHKAAQMLDDNIVDDSLYLLFTWQAESSTLTAVVTDDTKRKDATHIVRCQFPSTIDSTLSVDDDPFSSDLIYWIRDYLTTSDEYMRFSLVALFTDGARDTTSML